MQDEPEETKDLLISWGLSANNTWFDEKKKKSGNHEHLMLTKVEK